MFYNARLGSMFYGPRDVIALNFLIFHQGPRDKKNQTCVIISHVHLEQILVSKAISNLFLRGKRERTTHIQTVQKPR